MNSNSIYEIVIYNLKNSQKFLGNVNTTWDKALKRRGVLKLIDYKNMFNPLKMAGDMKGMEKMLKPALEKFMQESGFVKESELKKLEKRVAELEAKIKNI